MAKIGLCIVYRNNNYGSILQSFATLVELDTLGFEYEIIRYEKRKDIWFYLKSIPRLLNKDMVYTKMRSLKRKLGKKRDKAFQANDAIRNRAFQRFTDIYFKPYTEIIDNYDSLREKAYSYQNVLVGSDQLWLPAGLESNFYNLMFVPDNVNKIAYAASFGVSVIPDRQKEKTITYLKRINHISVREHSGQKIIKELTGKEVPVIVDPTLVIGKDHWDRFIPDQKIINEEYIFCYFLGNNPSQREEAKKLSNKTGLKIVTLRHLDEYIASDESFGDYAPYDVGPAEFVNLIRHATYICTDSFHGSVFSLINHKQFVSFNRYSEGTNSRNSRLDTLFFNAGVNRRFSGDIIEDMMKPIDYESVDANLEKCRKFAQDYLRGALDDRD